LRADIVLNNLVGHAVLSGDVRVLSDGTPWRPLVHAQDIASAFRMALEAPINKIHCKAYNVGAEFNNLTVADIAQSVVDVVPGARLLITGETGADPRSYRVDFSAFREALGFEAAWTVSDGAAELFKEYTSAGLTEHDFAKKFTRLPHLESLRAGGVLDSTMRRVTADV
jgi:nucleoside-diphosphate-sugar epimerase